MGEHYTLNPAGELVLPDGTTFKQVDDALRIAGQLPEIGEEPLGDAYTVEYSNSN